MKLISMTDFVLYQNKNFKSDRFYQGQFKDNVVNYANFLKQPLKLEMFVPCDEDGNVLEEPDQEFELTFWDYSTKMSKYEQAKEKVLFEEFEIATNKEGEKVILGDYTCLKVSDLENGTIEDLIKYVNIKLTKSAIKRIFG
jgi:hypothetical protein